MWIWIGLPVNLPVPLEGGELLSNTRIKGECAADKGRQVLRSGVPTAHWGCSRTVVIRPEVNPLKHKDCYTRLGACSGDMHVLGKQP